MDTPTITYVAAWATAAVAGGTLALAGATYWLGRKAKDELTEAVKQSKAMTDQSAAMSTQTDAVIDQRDEMRRQADVAEAALNASIRPLLVNVPERDVEVEVDLSSINAVISEHRAGYFGVPVRNVGAGLALGVAAAAAFAPANAVGGPVARADAPSVIAPGETEYVYFEDTAGPAAAAAKTPLVSLIESEADLLVEVVYTDVAGRQKTASTLHLTNYEDGGLNAYRVTSVDPGHEPRLSPP